MAFTEMCHNFPFPVGMLYSQLSAHTGAYQPRTRYFRFGFLPVGKPVKGRHVPLHWAFPNSSRSSWEATRTFQLDFQQWANFSFSILHLPCLSFFLFSFFLSFLISFIIWLEVECRAFFESKQNYGVSKLVKHLTFFFFFKLRLQNLKCVFLRAKPIEFYWNQTHIIQQKTEKIYVIHFCIKGSYMPLIKEAR